MLRQLSVVAIALLLGGCAARSDTAKAESVDCAVDKCVAFTFDDGPTPFTDRLLGVLNDAGAKATFFMIGNKVAANPDGAKRVAQAGMEIGNHTWEHPNMTTIPSADVPAQLGKAQDAIRSATGSNIIRTATSTMPITKARTTCSTTRGRPNRNGAWTRHRNSSAERKRDFKTKYVMKGI